MGVRTVTILSDDVTGEENESVEQFTFTLPEMVEEDGETVVAFVKYSLYATPETVSELCKAIARPTKKFRDVAERKVRGADSSGDSESEAIRDWARQNGHKVADRGRIAKTVSDAYYAAHSNGEAVTADSE